MSAFRGTTSVPLRTRLSRVLDSATVTTTEVITASKEGTSSSSSVYRGAAHASWDDHYLASGSNPEWDARRNEANAKRSYEAAIHYLKPLPLNSLERRAFDDKTSGLDCC